MVVQAGLWERGSKLFDIGHARLRVVFSRECIVSRCSLLAAPDAEQHGVRLLRELPPEPLPVKVDVDLIKQAILNVVLNGVQAMPNGGTLSLTAHREDETVVTEVRDQGLGIPAAVQDKIFELYFTTKKSGTGIGLAQTYQIMQWHYGGVDFESAEGKGTVFRLRLPVVEAPSAHQPEIANGNPVLVRKG